VFLSSLRSLVCSYISLALFYLVFRASSASIRALASQPLRQPVQGQQLGVVMEASLLLLS